MIAAAVFIAPQRLRRRLAAVALPSGGRQILQVLLQGLVWRHRQSLPGENSGAQKDRLLHAEKVFPAGFPGEPFDGPARGRVVGPEGVHGLSALAGALEDNLPPTVAQMHRPGHGFAAPGEVPGLHRQSVPALALRRVHAVEHGHQEGCPGAFPRAVGQAQHVQPRRGPQHRAVQAAEGGLHLNQLHGPSLPSRAAIKYRAASSAAVSPAAWAAWSLWSARPRRLPSPASAHRSRRGVV